VDPRLIALGLTEDGTPAAADLAPTPTPAPDPIARLLEQTVRPLDQDTTSRIRAAVVRLHDHAEEHLSRLVQIPSISPNYPGQDAAAVVGGETRCAELLAEIYRAAGAEVELFGQVRGRDNAVGRIQGAGGGRSLIYNGHTDVVPPGPDDDWADGNPWSGRIANGRVWGRGASDMKAGLVAQAMAALALRQAGVDLAGDLILEAVVGEEMMEHDLGTTACVERGYRADAAVVSEPSGPPSPLAVCPVSPGVLWFTVSVEGKATHTSMRGQTLEPGGEATGVSAVDKIVLIHQALAVLEHDWRFIKMHPLFQQGHFSILPGVIVGAPRSGLVPFVIPDEARLEVIVWYSPSDTAEDVREEVEECIGRVTAADRWLRVHPPAVQWRHHWPKSVLDQQHAIVAATADAHLMATGRRAVVAGFPAVEDTTWLNAAGIPAISYGPGDLRAAHAVNESADIEEMFEATLTFALLAAEWCGVAG
jgi:acetylornithine deacetylase/succinyl-diaminopimelate desuccinylase family protein